VIGLSATGEAVVLPLLATQILWINLVTDSGPALAMGVDPETNDVMARGPRRQDEPAIDLRMWTGVLVMGLAMALCTLLTIDLFLPGGLIEGGHSLELARTAGFTVLVLAQLFNCFNARSEDVSAFHGVFDNKWLWAAVALSLALQVGVVHVPWLNVGFGTVPLTLAQWAVCFAMASTVLWVSELRKLLLRVSLR
jgi:Ca2+-transporting ATPase